MAAAESRSLMEKIPLLNQDQVQYSDKYADEKYEYRHVILPREFGKYVPRTHLMTETEWRNLGIQQSIGWEHYLIHTPEPHLLLFRRPVCQDVQSNAQAVVYETTDVTMDSFDACGVGSTENGDTTDENCPLFFEVNVFGKK